MTKSKLLLGLALAMLPIVAHADITINDDDSSIVYSLGAEGNTDWNHYTGGGDLFGDEWSGNLYQTTGPTFQGDNAAVTFNGTGITWIGAKGPNYGIAQYSIDGGTPSTLDNYAATKANNQNFVMASGLTAGPHVLKVGTSSSKNGSSSDYYQTILGFTINGSSAAALPLSSGTVEPFSGMTATGTWSSGTDSGDFPTGHCWSNTTGSSLSWNFTGSLIEVYGRPDLEDGYMDVYIDNVQVAKVDGHAGTVDNDAVNSVLMFAKQVTSGNHTLKLVVDGTHDSYATNNYVQIEEAVAFPGSGGGGGGNLITNPGFESQTSSSLVSPWYSTGTAEFGVDVNAGQAHSGLNEAWIYLPSATASVWNEIDQNVTFSAGKTLALSAWVRSAASYSGAGYLGVRFSDGSHQEIQFTPGTSYAQISKTGITTGTFTSGEVYCGFWSPASGSSWMQEDDFSLTSN